MQIQERNKILQDLDKEYIDFLRFRRKNTQSVYLNTIKPTDKEELKLEKLFAKQFIKLSKLYTKMICLEKQKENELNIKDILLYTYQNPPKTKINRWLQYHDRQLKVADEYVRLKKEFLKTFPNPVTLV